MRKIVTDERLYDVDYQFIFNNNNYISLYKDYTSILVVFSKNLELPINTTAGCYYGYGYVGIK